MEFQPIPSPHIADYVVLGLFLCVCMGIGIFYGYRTDKQKTLENYLFGNRKLLLVPVSMSLFVTFASAISLMGIPAEIYIYGTMFMYSTIGFLFSVWISGITIVPMLYPLKLTSTYEYLQLRFRSKAVRLLGTLIGMLQTIAYMGVTLYAPALALQTVAGFPLWVSVVVIGAIGTFYTSIGGIKSVVWTDVFQFLMLFTGITAVIIKGLILVGTGDELKTQLEGGNRLQFNDISPDPSVRHTVWGCLIGLIFTWLPSWCSQASIQRISSLRSIKAAQNAFFLMLPIILIYNIVLMFMGSLMYTYYRMSNCGPFEAGFVTSMNQMTPYFVFDVLRTLPGMSGVYVSCLFSGSLSTLSSGLNALAANTVEDVLPRSFRSSKISLAKIAKLTVLIYGVFAIGIAYTLQYVSGPITQITLAIFGACGGPMGGLFFLGGLFPNANWLGALVGSVSALVINMWIAIGAQLYGSAPVRLEPITTSGCFANDSSTFNPLSYQIWNNTNTTMMTDLNVTNVVSDFVDPSMYVDVMLILLFFVLDIQFYSIVKTSILDFVNSFTAFLLGFDRGNVVDSSLIFPCCRRFWGLEVDRLTMIETYQITLLPKKESQNQHIPKQAIVSRTPPFDLPSQPE
ncbi:sodium-coupled monocarboxylate transporter 1-like [Ylistrum balloti]|uniref:sodium-coupled monocarboxylate transporter 1-like n=1 Tax=Ylistrum balloti TaxID=509963 RepID=UPI002905D95B|nr:sodium-coupled monocarboxylate transporter 1-like [Ylistrum balloti]